MITAAIEAESSACLARNLPVDVWTWWWRCRHRTALLFIELNPGSEKLVKSKILSHVEQGKKLVKLCWHSSNFVTLRFDEFFARKFNEGKIREMPLSNLNANCKQTFDGIYTFNNFSVLRFDKLKICLQFGLKNSSLEFHE